MPEGITTSDWWKLKFLDVRDWLKDSTLGTVALTLNPGVKQLLEKPEVKKLLEEQRRKLEAIKVGQVFNYEYAWIIKWNRIGGPPTSDPNSAFMINKNGRRWFPEEGEIISGALESITTQFDIVFFSVSKTGPFGKDSRLFIIQPGSTVDFSVANGFILRSGKLEEDKSFRTAAQFDEVMSYYSCSADEGIGSIIKAEVDMQKKLIPSNIKDTLAIKDYLADWVIAEGSKNSGVFGVVTGMLPPWMFPVEFASNLVLNVFKAQIAYAISYCYGKEATGDNLKNDLYILFANDDVEVSLKAVASAAEGAGLQTIAWEAISKETLWQKLGSKFLSIGKSTLQDAAKVACTAKVIGKAIPVVSIGIGVVTNTYEAGKFGKQAKRYYRPAPAAGSAPAPAINAKSVTVSFDPRGGTPKPANMSATSSYSYGSLPTVTLTGHRFDGWFDAATGGKKIESSSKVPDNSHTLFAHWTAKNIRVSFDPKGGSAPNPSYKEIPFGSAYGPLPSVTKAGCTFNGWNALVAGGEPVGPSTTMKKEIGHTLYALWSTPGGMTVTFNANGGNTPNPATKSVTHGSAYGSLANCSRSGYRFDGWFTAASGGTKVEASTLFTGGNTLYAHWTPLSAVTIAFDAAGGTPIPAAKGLSSPGSQYGTLPSVTRPGYKFDGWFTAASGGTKVEASTVATASTKLYAHWTDISGVTVTFDSKGGSTPNPASKSVIPDSTYGPLPTVARDGYKFEGWFNAASGGTKIESSAKVTNKSAHTLYARWTAINVTVAFNINGGKPPTPLNKILPFDSNYGSLPTAARDGYKLDGWYTAASGGTKVEASTKVANKNAHTLYAHWAGSAVTLTFNSNGGSAPNPATRQMTVGSPYGTLPTVTRDGYKFDGWFNAASGGAKIDPSGPFSGNVTTIYARWTAASGITVTFDASGGAPTPASKAVTFGANYSLPPVSRPGYKFDGWYTAATGGTKVEGATKVSSTANHTLYARWTAISVTVAFNASGGSAPNPVNKAVTNGSAYGPLPAVTKTGHNFEGWYTAATGGTRVEPSTIVSSAGNHTLYARWTGNTVTVTFHRNGAENNSPPIPQATAVYNSKVTLPAPPVRPDYTFEGWNTKADGSGTVFNAGTPVTADIGVYAKWKANAPKSITITFNANGGTPNTTSQVTVGSPLGTLPKVRREGFRFDGWYNAASGGGKINSSDPISGNYTTFYAHWTEITFTVTFHRNGGTSDAIPQVTVAYNGRITLPRQPTRPGYTFAGWFWDSRGSTPFSASTPITDDSEFYAHWNENASPSPQPAPTPSPSTPTCTVTFHRNGAENYNSPIPQITAACNSRISLPSSPNWPGHTFTGWNTSGHGTGNAFTGDIPNTSALAVYAIWREDAPASQPSQQPASNTMTVYFDSAGGSPPNPSSRQLVAKRDSIGQLPTVTKPGYTFDGWFTPSGNKLTADHSFSGGYTTIIAHWRK